jgi:hypothetical protein
MVRREAFEGMGSLSRDEAMIAGKKCSECEGSPMAGLQPYSSRPICRPCYLARLKMILAESDGPEFQRATILAELRKIEEEGL